MVSKDKGPPLTKSIIRAWLRLRRNTMGLRRNGMRLQFPRSFWANMDVKEESLPSNRFKCLFQGEM